MTHAAIYKHILRIFSCLCIVQLTRSFAVSEIEIPSLPCDENEASRMLEEGTLDSSVWRKIEPYYTIPVNVPHGELGILQDLFPDLPGGLPTRINELSRYTPWNDENIRKFFSEFPEMTAFKPILSFDYGTRAVFPARAGFYYSRRGATDTARQYVLLSIGKEAGISAGGRIDFTDALGRWFRRSISAEPASRVRVTGGNFSPHRRTGLISGYFPSTADNDTAVAKNWFYGEAKTWNGAAVTASRSCETQAPFVSDAEAYFHAGRTENIGHLSSTMVLSKQASWFTGLSFIHAMDADARISDLWYFHAGLEFAPLYRWRCTMQSALNGKDPAAVPWSISVIHTAEESSFSGTFTGIPREYTAPRSETVRLLRTKARGDSISGYLIDADLSLRKRIIHSVLSGAPRLNFLMSDGRLRYLSAGIDLSGRSWCDFRLWYRWSPLFDENEITSRQQFAAECSLPVIQQVRIDLSSATMFRTDYWSSRFRVTVPFKANRVLMLSPHFAADAARTGIHEKRLGFGQRLQLYDRNFSDMTIEQKLPFSSWRTLRVRGAMLFYF